MKTILVVGFITDGKRVLLIKKNRPLWQKGLFNGIGGAAEINEIPIEAMKRETKEETGLHIEKWVEINKLCYDNDAELYIYQTIIPSEQIENFETLTDEHVGIFDRNNLPKNLVPDVSDIINHRMKKYVLTPVKNINFC